MNLTHQSYSNSNLRLNTTDLLCVWPQSEPCIQCIFSSNTSIVLDHTPSQTLHFDKWQRILWLFLHFFIQQRLFFSPRGFVVQGHNFSLSHMFMDDFFPVCSLLFILSELAAWLPGKSSQFRKIFCLHPWKTLAMLKDEMNTVTQQKMQYPPGYHRASHF